MSAPVIRAKSDITTFDDVTCRVLLLQLSQAGLIQGSPYTTANPTPGFSVVSKYERWLTETLSLLQRRGYINDTHGAAANGVSPSDAQATWSLWHELLAKWSTDQDIRLQMELVDETLQSLPEILAGKKLITEIIFSDASMEKVGGIYGNNAQADKFNCALARCAAGWMEQRLGGDKKTTFRIVEIGAGTGSTTVKVLEALYPLQRHVREYVYTDLSEAFMIRGREKLADQASYLSFQILDVERSPEHQGLKIGSCDIAIAANVLHATRNIRNTLRHTKATLKHHGLLLLNELCEFNLFCHLTFGLLDGWWRYEDPALRVPGTPLLSTESWRRVLSEEGFLRIEVSKIDGAWGAQHIIRGESDGVIRRSSVSLGNRQIDSCKVFEPLRGKHSVWLAGDENAGHSPPFRKHANSNSIAGAELRKIVRDCVASALRMDESRIQDHDKFADYGVDSIVAVGVVNEISRRCNVRLSATVVFDYPTIDGLVQHLLVKYSIKTETLERDEASIVGAKPGSLAAGASVLVSQMNPLSREAHRLFRDTRAGTNTNPTEQESIDIEKPQEGFYHRLLLERPGVIEDICLQVSRPAALKQNEVRIAVRATSLNFGDLLCIRGLYPSMPPYPFTPGMEVSGVVIQVGKRVSGVCAGDMVVGLMGEGFGGHATLATCADSMVWAKPSWLSFEEACSLPAVGLTVLEAFERARPRPNETILIQSATGGVGLIAIQLATYMKLKIIATAGSAFKVDYLIKTGATHAFNYRDTDFEKEVKHLTGGKGVDILINTLAGDAIQKGLNCMAAGGRYIEIAMTAIKSMKSLDMSVLNDNQSVISIDLRKLGDRRPDIIAARMEQLWAYADKRIIRPTLGRVFSLTEVKEAYKQLERRDNIGKLVMRIPQALCVNSETGSENGADRKSPETAQMANREEIAIIGMSAKFPKSDGVEALWQHLVNGHDLVDEGPPVGRFPNPSSNDLRPGPRACHRGGFINGIDRFDPLFFDISVAEAVYMDPQQRLFLQETWRALEDSGYAPDALKGMQCGVYVGCGGGDYAQLLTRDAPAQAFWGNSNSVIPARIAYYLDLHGPALAVDTACSSSLVAIHLACQGLWNNETSMAVAGGVFVQCTPAFYQLANRAGMLSRAGRCHVFDQRADGFVPGEGVAAVVLKRLREALADGDNIYGVIRGSGINQDGATNGITAPSARSQERLERQVYESFRINPDEIQMIEAHGTGTKLGDPVEYEALTNAFRQHTQRRAYCAIGSIKTNIGHAASAAGVAGVIKVLLALKHECIPPSLHFENRNSHINFEDSPFFVCTKSLDWPRSEDRKRCAAVSSFGFSGTNAHLVIGDAPVQSRRQPTLVSQIIALSAETPGQLRQQVERIMSHCVDNPEVDCGNFSFTLLTGRKHCRHRLAFVASTVENILQTLKSLIANEAGIRVYISTEEGVNRNTPQHTNDPVLQSLVDMAKERESEERRSGLAEIAQRYVSGQTIDFRLMFRIGDFQRISLPSYPFSEERFWLPDLAYDDARDKSDDSIILQIPEWAPATAGYDQLQHITYLDQADLVVVLLDWGTQIAIDIQQNADFVVKYATRCDGETAAKTSQDAFSLVLGLLRDLFKQKTKAQFRHIVIVPTSADAYAYSTLAGLYKTAGIENPRFRGKIVGLPLTTSSAKLREIIQSERMNDFRDLEVRYDDNFVRHVRQLVRQRAASSSGRGPWGTTGAALQDNSVYWIVGGLGGIGKLLVRYLVQTTGVTIAITGRRPLDAAVRTELDGLRASLDSSDRLIYIAADMGDIDALRAAYTSIKRTFGRIDGVVNCAGVLRDSLIVNKTSLEVASVLRPKILGTSNLDEVLVGEPIRFFVLFSSLSSVFGGLGQSDYAAANSYLDAFASHRNQLVNSGIRSGWTVAINWGPWTAGGMQMSKNVRDFLLERYGIEALDTAEGMWAFERALQMRCDQVVVIKQRPSNGLRSSEPNALLEEQRSDRNYSNMDAIDLTYETAETRIKMAISSVTQIPSARMNRGLSFGELGIDSIMAAKITEILEDQFGALPRMVLYEYSTIGDLHDYLVNTKMAGPKVL
jgi:polyketide synthase PksM